MRNNDIQQIKQQEEIGNLYDSFLWGDRES